jgi:hypothetical protein
MATSYGVPIVGKDGRRTVYEVKINPGRTAFLTAIGNNKKPWTEFTTDKMPSPSPSMYGLNSHGEVWSMHSPGKSSSSRIYIPSPPPELRRVGLNLPSVYGC